MTRSQSHLHQSVTPRPRLLDLFCGAGGAAVGYYRAGFEVVGVDIKPQPDYPFEFHEGDAVTFPLAGFAAIHASPPCQAYTTMGAMWNARQDHPELLDIMRDRLSESGLPYVIENVPGAPMNGAHVTLCGSVFGLGTGEFELRRHRHFETSFPVLVPPCQHSKPTIGIYGDHARDRRRVGSSKDRGRDIATDEATRVALAREAMGMPWITRWKSASEAIPPVYTEHIGGYLMAALGTKVAA